MRKSQNEKANGPPTEWRTQAPTHADVKMWRWPVFEKIELERLERKRPARHQALRRGSGREGAQPFPGFVPRIAVALIASSMELDSGQTQRALDKIICRLLAERS